MMELRFERISLNLWTPITVRRLTDICCFFFCLFTFSLCYFDAIVIPVVVFYPSS